MKNSFLDLSTNQIIELLTKQLNFKLKAIGRNIFFNCPFHDDKTPSFCFNPEYKLFKCFACINFNKGKVGSILNFWSEFKNIKLEETINEISVLTGIKIKYESTDEKKNIFFNFCNTINDIYHYNLFTKQGFLVKEYLKNQRNLEEKTIKRFKLGCIINQNQLSTLIFYKEKFKKISQRLINVWKITNEGKIKDFFSYIPSLIIPLSDELGNIIAWVSRNITDKEENKYIFLSNYMNDICFYSKLDVLFNFNTVKDLKEEECFLVEGIFDVISLTQIGIENCVALLGSSISNKQLNLLKLLKKKIIIFLDNDKAGIEASIKISVYLLIKNIECEIIEYKIKEEHLKKKLDPDELCKYKLIDNIIKQKQNPFLFALNYYFKYYFIKENPQKISIFINKIFEIFKKCYFAHNFLTQQLSLMTNLKKEDIFSHLFEFKNSLTFSDILWFELFCQKKIYIAEKKLLQFCYLNRIYWTLIDNREYSFNNKETRKKYLIVHEYYSFSSDNISYNQKKENNIPKNEEQLNLNSALCLLEQIKQIKLFKKNHFSYTYEKE